MSAALEQLRNEKAGWSSMCRTGGHSTCRMARARCTCPCHGPNGQQPPTPTPPQSNVPRPTPVVAPQPEETPVPESTVDSYPCQVDGCNRTFASPHARLVHASRGHKKPASPVRIVPDTAPKGMAARKVAPAVEVLLVHTDHDLHVLPLQTTVDAERTAEILRDLGHEVQRAVIQP